MPSLKSVIDPFLTKPSPFLIHGDIPATLSETPEELVQYILTSRSDGVNYFPAFSPQTTKFDVATSEITTGSIPRAAFDILGPKARTIHPTHSWIVTGRSAPMMIPGNAYAMTPSGMGSPVTEITNFSSFEFIIGRDLTTSVVIEAAEEQAKVPYALQDAAVSISTQSADGTVKEGSFILRQPENPTRNHKRIRQLWLENEAIVEEDWGFVIQTRIAYESLVRALRVDPSYLTQLD